MENWKDYQMLNSLIHFENKDSYFEVMGIMQKYFDLKEIMGKIGYLLAELEVKGNGIDLVNLPMGKVFEPNIFERDQFYKDMEKAENEFFLIHKMLNKIANQEAGTVEIQIKLNKGKRSKETIIIQQDEVLQMIFKQLSNLPDGKLLQKQGSGRPGQEVYKDFIKESVEKCFRIIEPTNPNLTETDKLFFAGLVLSLAGIMPPPRDYNDGYEIESHQLQIYKDKVSDALKYYKPTGK